MSRSLTQDELGLVRWLLENGTDAASAYVSQLGTLTVDSMCECGCASINFAVDGKTPDTKSGMNILADYEWDGENGELMGVFVFAHGDRLSGLEVWSPDGLSDCTVLPNPSQLRPLVVNRVG
jgi:hypothetical protein